METISKIQKWGDAHHPLWVDFFRIALGLVLMWKGLQFATHLGAFTQLMVSTDVGQSIGISLVAHLVILIHILGGLMIALGTQTRLACLFQLPIVLAAIFLVNLPAKLLQPYAEFWLSISVLVALVFFLIEGNGPLSVDHPATEKEKTLV